MEIEFGVAPISLCLDVLRYECNDAFLLEDRNWLISGFRVRHRYLSADFGKFSITTDDLYQGRNDFDTFIRGDADSLIWGTTEENLSLKEERTGVLSADCSIQFRYDALQVIFDLTYGIHHIEHIRDAFNTAVKAFPRRME